MSRTVLCFRTICEGTWDFLGGNHGNFAFPAVITRFQQQNLKRSPKVGQKKKKKKTLNTHTHTLLDGKQNTRVGFGHCNTGAVNFELMSPKVVRTQEI